MIYRPSKNVRRCAVHEKFHKHTCTNCSKTRKAYFLPKKSWVRKRNAFPAPVCNIKISGIKIDLRKHHLLYIFRKSLLLYARSSCMGIGARNENFRNTAGFFRASEELEGVVAPWCNPLTLQPKQSGGVGFESQ